MTFEEYYIKAKEKYNSIFFSIVGSQNYLLNTEKSDLDTYFVIAPSIDDICQNRKPVSGSLFHEDGSVTTVKDIRIFKNELISCSPNSFETLFSEQMTCDKMDFFPIMAKKEEIVRLNPWRLVQSLTGMAENQYKRMYQNTEVYGYNPKMAYQIVRIKKMLQRYVDNDSYINCLHLDKLDRDFILEIKNGRYSIKEIEAIINTSMSEIQKIADNYPNAPINFELIDFLNETVNKIIKNSFKEELNV